LWEGLVYHRCWHGYCLVLRWNELGPGEEGTGEEDQGEEERRREGGGRKGRGEEEGGRRREGRRGEGRRGGKKEGGDREGGEEREEGKLDIWHLSRCYSLPKGQSLSKASEATIDTTLSVRISCHWVATRRVQDDTSSFIAPHAYAQQAFVCVYLSG